MNNTRGKSKNPNGRYLWLRTQIGSMLKNQTYLGHVVSGKREQISPKLKKGIQKSKEEFIVVKNMHEPIIDEELWNKVQERLKSYNTDNRKKYDYILKDLVYCSECGSKAVFCHNKSKTKSGRVCWEGNHARCSKQNDYKSLCNNKAIGERVLLDTVKEVIIKELESIEYTTKELKEIYEKAERKARSTIKTIEDKIKEKNKELSVIQEKATELYRKKLSKSIETEKFTEQYKKINEEKENIIMQLNELQEQKKKTKTKDTKSRSEINKIKKIANEFLSMKNPDREIIKKLVERIEFDKNKNITIKLTFSNPYKEKKVVHRTSGEKYIKNKKRIECRNVVAEVTTKK